MNQMSHITLWVSHCQHKYTNREVGGRQRQICGCTHANLDRRQDDFSLCNSRKKHSKKKTFRFIIALQTAVAGSEPTPLANATPMSSLYLWVGVFGRGEQKKKSLRTLQILPPTTDKTGTSRGADPSGRTGTARRPSWSALPRSPCNPTLQMKSWGIMLNPNRSLQSSALLMQLCPCEPHKLLNPTFSARISLQPEERRRLFSY